MDKILIGLAVLAAGMLAFFVFVGFKSEAPSPIPEKTLSVLPDSRSFYLGMSPWPYDFTTQARLETFDIVNAHTDMVTHHFDFGVPWPEAFEGTAFHPNVETEIEVRLAKQAPGQKVFLALSPQHGERNELAGYWAEGWHMHNPGGWGNKFFDDPDVITAYLSYALRMIERFQPDYFAYAIEANDSFTNEDDPQFESFLIFAAEVYEQLKLAHPRLRVFATISTFALENDDSLEVRMRLAELLMPYSDMIAISTYPYWITAPANGVADPSTLPRDWFERWRNLAPRKPFAVSETGYPAEDVVMFAGDEKMVDIAASVNAQTAYVRWMFEEMNRLNGEFVSWFVPRDYDLGWEQLQANGEDEFTKLWRDTGLLDGAGKARPALALWDAWLRTPLRR